MVKEALTVRANWALCVHTHLTLVLTLQGVGGLFSLTVWAQKPLFIPRPGRKTQGSGHRFPSVPTEEQDTLREVSDYLSTLPTEPTLVQSAPQPSWALPPPRTPPQAQPILSCLVAVSRMVPRLPGAVVGGSRQIPEACW